MVDRLLLKPDHLGEAHAVQDLHVKDLLYRRLELQQGNHLAASQVHHTIASEVYGNAAPKGVIYIGDKKVGEFMKKKVFEPGRTLDWKGVTKHATGEELNPQAFARDFQGE